MSTPTYLIGLAGYAGTGKDTVRAMLQYLGYTGFAFADPIRKMLRQLLSDSGIDDRFIHDRAFKEVAIHELGVSYRQMAQTLGTEWGRNLVPDFWLRIAQAYLDDQVDMGGTHFTVSDVRFVNEAQWVRQNGGVIWRIERPDVVPVRAHTSEQELYHFKADTVLHNTGTVGDLHHAVVSALDRLN
jgi:hypothetical protein